MAWRTQKREWEAHKDHKLKWAPLSLSISISLNLSHSSWIQASFFPLRSLSAHTPSVYTERILRISSAMAGCTTDLTRSQSCRDSAAAFHLKLIAIVVIFLTSVLGISTPVALARLFQGKPTYNNALLVIKCFAAGVILSTSLVHVLPDAFDALADCQIASHHPWKDFPFSGFVAMVGAIVALLVDIAASSHMHSGDRPPQYAPVVADDGASPVKKVEEEEAAIGCHAQESSSSSSQVEELARVKQRLVSQVLEIGIIFHSVIIGVTLGMSQNRCTIKPLVAALAFHQIFEGMGLGGCIAQAGFSLGTTAYMCMMFSVTTPLGIMLGMIVFGITGYDDSSPNALVLEGLLGSLSSGILIYMALVDLIAADFFHNKMMSSSLRMKKACFIALVLGSASMSILAIWA